MYPAYKPAGSKCVWCNANKRDNPTRKFFSFPKKMEENPNLLSQWIVNCGNEKLFGLTMAQLKNQRVCDRHFERQCFTSDMRIYLEKYAIPTLHCTSDDDTCSAMTVTTTTSTTAKTTTTTTKLIQQNRQDPKVRAPTVGFLVVL
jgi:hypothetical protein